MKKLEEIKRLLVVVDMINGFVKEGSLSDKYIERIIPNIKELIQDFRESDDALVAFVRDAHNESSAEFSKFPKHCIDGTWESELVDELKPYRSRSIDYKKNARSLMFGTSFVSDLEKMKLLKEVIVTGCCTDLCVLDLVLPLVNYFDAFNRSVDVVVPMDAVETYDALGHERDVYNDISFKLMKQEGIKLVKSYGGVKNGK